MAPTSRRKKLYDEKQRKVQGRNFVAAIFFLLVIGGTYFLIRQLMPSPLPTIHVSIARINHAGTREIPFSNNSCKIVSDTFSQNLQKCNVSPIHDVGEQDSDLDLMKSEVQQGDILIVYLNGHLTDANSRPSKWSTAGATGDGVDDEVYWVGPESDPGEKELSRFLLDIKDSPAKTKLVLLDAGRFSWSPVFPGRGPNEFQTRLAEKLKSDAWGLQDDFWIITSHSDAEISNVSTPLEGSLFSIAIREALESLAEDHSDQLPIQTLFEEIRDRTVSYSTNFEEKALQTPVLMKAGVGIVENTSPELDPLVVTWQTRESPESDEAKPAAEFEWQSFARNPDDFSKWLLSDPHIPALPKFALQKAEMFLDQGIEEERWTSSEQQILNEYETVRTQLEQRPLTPTYFDLGTLQAKNQQFSQFRSAIFELAIWNRFRNHMRFWNDDIIDKDIPEMTDVIQPILVADNQLTGSEAVPVVNRLPVRLRTFAAANEKLIEEVPKKRNRKDALTPMQAEMLGIASQRYLPLLQQFRALPPATSENGTDRAPPGEDQENKTFTLTLEKKSDIPRYDPLDKQGTDQPPGTGFRAVVDLARSEVKDWATLEPTADTSTRYALAAVGSEFFSPEKFPRAKKGIVPNIEWKPVERQIKVAPLADASVFKVPFYDRREIQFQLSTSVVESVDLKIEMIETEKPEGLQFGFDKDFDPKLSLTQLDGNNYRYGKPFTLYFRYPDPKQALIGKRFRFQISGLDRKSPTDKYAPYEFTVEITKDAEFKIASNRVFARSNGRPVRLYRWGIPPDLELWEPVQMRTLANVKSGFEFEVAFDFDTTKYFTAKIFKIEDKANTNANLSSDRSEPEIIRNFVRALDNESKKAGTPPLDRRESFEQIAQAEFELRKTERTAQIKFIRPPKKADEPPDPEPTKTVEVENGLMIVFYETEKPDPKAEVKLDPTENRTPDWYQFISFDPQEPAIPKNDRLKIKPWLFDRLGADINNLEDHLAPVVDPKQAARLTIVSRKSFVEKTNDMEPLDLTNALSGDGEELFPEPRSGDNALLILDLLGIPNYLTLDTDGLSLKSSGFRSSLTGIRFSQKSSNWEVYPKTWSFASEQLPKPPVEWLAGRASEFQNIYVRIDPPEEGKGEGNGEVELFLPIKGAFLNLGNDFTLIWRGRVEQLANPQLRKHVFAIGETGVTAWSELTSHTVDLSRISNKELIIHRKGESKPLGQWRFITESPGNGPKLTGKPVEFENNPLQMARATVTLDVRHITPPIDSDSIKLSIDGKELPKDGMKRLMNSRTVKIENGLYKFSFAKLRELAGLETPPKRNTIIQAKITDFFGEVIPHELPLRINEPKKPVPPPKPTFIDVTFAYGDKPVDLLKFTGIRLKQGAKVLNTDTGSIKVVQDKQTPSLKFEGVFPGTYSLQVDAQIRQGGSQYLRATAQQARIVVSKEGAKITLTFK